MKKYIYSTLFAIVSIVIFAVGITNILALNALENVSFEEYLKIAVFMSFGVFSAFGSIIVIKPELKFLETITKKYKVFEKLSLIILSILTIFFIYAAAIGLINGELRFFGHREVDWAIYKNNKMYYLLALLQHIFGIIVCVILWAGRLRSIKHEKSNK